MITRIYADNFRTLVNFEWKPAKLALLLGDNGSGKTSIVDVLWGIRGLVAGDGEVRFWFPESTRTTWDTRVEQRFELDATIDGLGYRYELVVEHDVDDPLHTRIRRERLFAGDHLLVDFDGGALNLVHDDGTSGAALNTRWTWSGVGAIAPGKDDKKLALFKRWLADDVWCFAPDPRAMSSRTDEEAEGLDESLENFASWYPRWLSQDLSAALSVQQDLRKVIAGFDTLHVSKTSPTLQARFKGVDGGAGYSIDFDDLSDGQRQLCALYVIRHAVVQPGRLVVFDEPDNYVALREIQPWLTEVLDAALQSDGPQVWFISHHPEMLNQLAPSHGTRFYRDGGPTLKEAFRGMEGLSSADVVARGWDGE